MKTRWLLMTAALAFVLSLIANLPAALLYAGLRPAESPVQAFGLQGPWTQGAASGITVGGRLVAQDLRWQFKPLHLLLGRAAFAVEGGGELATLQGVIAASPRAVRLHDLRLAGSLKRLAATAGHGYLPVDGQLGGEIAMLVLVNGFVDSAEATINLQGLAWTLAREPMTLGDFRVQISTTPEAIRADITSPAGPLEAQGQARLFPDKRYEADIALKLKPTAGIMLGNYVRSLGAPDTEGWYHLRQKGQLP